MKKLSISILLVLSCIVSHGQFVNNQTVSSASTLYHARGGLIGDGGLIIATFPDTTTANNNYIGYYNGAMIMVNNYIWYRYAGKWNTFSSKGYVDSVLSLKVSYTDTATMLGGYARSGWVVKYTDTALILSGYGRYGQLVKYTDTSFMLTPYLRAYQGVKYLDTAAMLSGYGRFGWLVKYTDTASMLTNLLRKSDTLTMLSGYGRFGWLVKYTDTAGEASRHFTSGILQASSFPALTGDITTTAGSVNTTAKSVGIPGTYGSASTVPVLTTDYAGRVTGVTNTSIQISESQVTNLVTDLANKAPITGGTGYIQNQNGSNLTAQTAKFWITDTIKTNGPIVTTYGLFTGTTQLSKYQGTDGTLETYSTWYNQAGDYTHFGTSTNANKYGFVVANRNFRIYAGVNQLAATFDSLKNVTVGNNLSITTVPALATAATTFLTTNGGVVSSRLPSQVLSDIGGAPASGSGSYIQNQTTQQASSNFNISNAGVVGTTLFVGNAITVNNGTSSTGNGVITMKTLSNTRAELGLVGTDGVNSGSDVYLYSYLDNATAIQIFRATRGTGAINFGNTVTIQSIPALGTTATNFLTSNAGVVSSRTPLQTLTDLGAISGLTGDVVATGPGNVSATIQPNVVTYAKLQQVAASSLVGNPTGVLANAQGITLGATLNFAGSALQTNALSGDVTTPANSFVATLATVNTNVGSWGTASSIPQFTVNGKGLVTAAANVPIQIAESQVTSLTTDLASKANLSGATFTGAVILNADPTTAFGAATKNYVDNLVTGLSWKQAVRAATTANITLSGTQTVDGIALAANDRVLVKNQTTASQNGLYLVAAGAWTRTSDASTGTQILGSAVYIQAGGTANGGTQYTNGNTTAPVIGTDAITYQQIAGAGVYTNGSGILLTGNVFSLDQSFTKGLFSAGTGLSYSNGVYTNTGVTSFSAGTTGLTPSAATSGAVTLAGTLAIANGGTGQTIASAAFNALSPMTTAGDLIYGGTAGAGTRLAAGTATQVLHGGTIPSWSAVSLTADVIGLLPNANLANPSFFIGTTSITLGRASAAQVLTGITSIDGLALSETFSTVTNRGNTTNVNLAVGVTGMQSWDANSRAIQIGYGGAIFAQNTNTPSIYLLSNTQYNGTNWVRGPSATDGPSSLVVYNGLGLYRDVAGTVGSTYTPTQIFGVNQSGYINASFPAGVAGNILVNNSGTISTRTAAQLLNDLGAASASGYVPYTGATGTVNLGTQSLIAGYLTLNNSGQVGKAQNTVSTTETYFTFYDSTGDYTHFGESTVNNKYGFAVSNRNFRIYTKINQLAATFDSLKNITAGADLLLYGSSASFTGDITANNTANRVYTLPDKNGTFAMISDLGSTSAALTMNNSGTGAASGTTFNGSTAQTISYNTIGAPSTTGTNASGTWGISITGNAATWSSQSYTNSQASAIDAVLVHNGTTWQYTSASLLNNFLGINAGGTLTNNITGTAAGETLATVAGRGNTYTGNIGIGGASMASWGSPFNALQISLGASFLGRNDGLPYAYISSNSTNNGANWLIQSSANYKPALLQLGDGGLTLSSGAVGAVGSIITYSSIFNINNTGTITTGIWNAGAVTSSGGITGNNGGIFYETGNLGSSYSLQMVRNTNTSPAGYFLQGVNAGITSTIFYLDVNGNFNTSGTGTFSGVINTGIPGIIFPTALTAAETWQIGTDNGLSPAGFYIYRSGTGGGYKLRIGEDNSVNVYGTLNTNTSSIIGGPASFTTITASGLITSTVTSGDAISITSATTGNINIHMGNSASNLFLGIANSTGGYWGSGSAGNNSINFGTTTAVGVGFATSNILRYTIDASGNNTWTGAGTFSSSVTATSFIGNLNNSLTFNNGGAGAASGTVFNNSAAQTISYNTIGAFPTTGGTLSGSVTATSFIKSGGTATQALMAAGGTTSLNYGTYTPTFTAVQNCTAATTATCQWMQIGGVVTVSGHIQVTATASSQVIFTITLPSTVANFASYAQLAGTGVHTDATNGQAVYQIFATNAAQTAKFSSVINANASQDIFFTFTYLQ